MNEPELGKIRWIYSRREKRRKEEKKREEKKREEKKREEERSKSTTLIITGLGPLDPDR